MNEKKAPKIFVVDDEPIIAMTLAEILKQSGFDAHAFTNPVEALAGVTKQSPQLLITDVVMPQMTGIALAIRVKEVLPDCKILLFSGQAATANLLDEASRDGHEFALLSKPVHPKDLLEALASMAK